MMGELSSTDVQGTGGSLPVAPSPIPINGDGIPTTSGKQPYETPRSLETAEIPRVVDDYRTAAARAKEAGFDGVEVHCSHGFLLGEFLSPITNKRTDE